VKSWIPIILFLITTGNFTGFSQELLSLKAKDTVSTTIDPLRPSKAAFYSALLPGAGQAYNKKYWKIPIVYAAMGISIYSYIWNQNKYDSYRDAYKERLLLGTSSTDQYVGILSDSRLIDAQKFHQRNRDLSLLVTAAFYVLNIVDANVDAHLQQFNVNGKLTIKPEIQTNPFTYKQHMGLTLNYTF
jgi:Family of unknown function (DUF5683)